jgi:hypothetical protein
MKKSLILPILSSVLFVSFLSCKKEDVRSSIRYLKSISTQVAGASQNFTVTYTYDNQNRLIEESGYEYRYTEPTKLIGFVDSNEFVTTYTLDNQKLITSIQTKYKTKDSINNNEITTFKFDAERRLINQSKKTNNKITETYEFQYSGTKLVKMIQSLRDIDPMSNDQTTTYTYEYSNDVKNTIDNEYKGLSFMGKGSDFLPTKMTYERIHSQKNGQIIAKNTREENHQYALDAAGYVFKDVLKVKRVTFGKELNSEETLTYSYY